jgi:collagenase-like PrtC family protease
MELICLAGTPVALRDAVDAGAGAVQCGFADETNASHYLALHFSRDEMIECIDYAHARGTKVIVAVDSFMRPGAEALWTAAVDDAVALGADAVLVSDIGLLAYVADKHPQQARHLALQLSAATAPHIAFLTEAFGIRRAVLPRGLLVSEVLQIATDSPCEIEAAAASVSLRRQGAGEAASGPSLDLLAHLGEMVEAGVAAVKVEDAPRGSAYVRGLVAQIDGVLQERAA